MVKIITIVVDAAEEVTSAIASAINELHSNGHTVNEVRVSDDTGETKLPVNTIDGVTVPPPEPAPAPETSVTAPGVPATAPSSSVTDVTTTKQVESGTSNTTPQEPPITGNSDVNAQPDTSGPVDPVTTPSVPVDEVTSDPNATTTSTGDN